MAPHRVLCREALWEMIGPDPRISKLYDQIRQQQQEQRAMWLKRKSEQGSDDEDEEDLSEGFEEEENLSEGSEEEEMLSGGSNEEDEMLSGGSNVEEKMLSGGSNEEDEMLSGGSNVEEKMLSGGSNEEEEKPSEGSVVGIQGEELDSEKAVETRVRKSSDLLMDEEEAMRKVKEIAWDVRCAWSGSRIGATEMVQKEKTEMVQKEKIDTDTLKSLFRFRLATNQGRGSYPMNLRFRLATNQEGRESYPMEDAPRVVSRWMAQQIVKNSTREMQGASVKKSGESMMEKLLARSRIILAEKGEAPVESETESEEDESLIDYNANEARLYRKFWIKIFSHRFGSYEDTTSIPAMRFTDTGPVPFASTNETLQIFSVKVAAIKEGLKWPLDIYGMVAIRDVVDHNRNIIFNRKRGNCQTITQEDPCLALIGPSRAVMLSVHGSTLEAVLKLKGVTESDDKEFSFLVTSYTHLAPSYSITRHHRVDSRLSTLEMTVGYIISSVEATISVKLIEGSWPDGFGGVFLASTTSIDDREIILLAFGEDKLPLGDGDEIELSRRVVSVEHPQYEGQLKVSTQAVRATEELIGELNFTPQEAGRSEHEFEIGSCKMRVTVAWSLLSSFR